MGLFKLFQKKSDYNSYVHSKKHLSAFSLAAFTNMFSEYSEFESERNMKIWDALFPIAICGYSSIIDKTVESPAKFNSLKNSISEQFIHGRELLEDYNEFIKSRNLRSEELSQHTAFWFSKNLQLYLPENLKLKVDELKFLNIISLFLTLSFYDDEHNYPNYLRTNFKSDLKTKSGMSEYAMLIESYCRNIFSLIKEKV
jgi:hypothetical protein